MTPSEYEVAEVSRLGNRKINQDRCLALESEGSLLLVLGDGLGGHPKGEVAADILVETCTKIFRITPKPIRNPLLFLNILVRRAHTNILTFGQGQSPPIEPRTTAVLALVQQQWVYWCHVGDSRFYALRRGRVMVRTQDHSYVQGLIEEGLISPRDTTHHPLRHYVTRCVGGTGDPPELSCATPLELEAGDGILLCSDGLWANLTEGQLASLTNRPDPLQLSLDRLANQAEAAAHPFADNISALAMRILPPGMAK